MRFAFWLPQIVMLLIAANQVRMAYFGNLTPWKGGGFGMFSTVDSPGARAFKIYARFDGYEIEIKKPRHLRKVIREARALASDRQLEKVASYLNRYSLIKGDYKKKARNPRLSTKELEFIPRSKVELEKLYKYIVQPGEIHMQILKPRFSGGHMRLSILNELRVKL